MTWKTKRHTLSEITTSFTTQWTSFGILFLNFFVSWSVWPVIYLMALPESAGVAGFAGKAPLFTRADQAEQTATLGSWLIKTSAVFLLHAAFSLPHLQNKRSAFFICNRFSSAVSFSRHDESCSVAARLPLYRFENQLLVSPLNECWLTDLVRFCAFCQPENISLTSLYLFSYFKKGKKVTVKVTILCHAAIATFSEINAITWFQSRLHAKQFIKSGEIQVNATIMEVEITLTTVLCSKGCFVHNESCKL